VGTPQQERGLDYAQVKHAARMVGQALRQKDGYHLVVIRSTIVPGITRGLDGIIRGELRGSGGACDFDICFMPEFLREGSAINDALASGINVVGVMDDAPRGLPLLKRFFSRLYAMPLEAAETLKLTCNAWHALKVVFANEIGALCAAWDVDADAVMTAFVSDTRLNISPAYLKPGFAFGGPCLPKDLHVLTHGLVAPIYPPLQLPLLQSIAESNVEHIERAARAIEATDAECVGIIGIAHKPKTADLRGSPSLVLIERLMLAHQVKRVLAYDPLVTREQCEYCVDSLDELLANSDALVLIHSVPDDLASRAGARPSIDLARHANLSS
jgi:GDP-mannose 6-dehydrogenase